MREFLFRGRQKNGLEWFEGDLSNLVHGAECYIFPADGWNSPDYYEVDPDTVGQYTGKLDKNGKRIFEGDIIKGFRYRDHGQWGENVACTYTVKWDDKKSAFYPLYFFDGYTFDIKTYEVIGNIYDNKELQEDPGGK